MRRACTVCVAVLLACAGGAVAQDGGRDRGGEVGAGVGVGAISRAVDAIDPGLASGAAASVAGAPEAPRAARAVIAEVGAGAGTFEAAQVLIDAAAGWEEWGRIAGRPSYVLFGLPEAGRLGAARLAAREVAALAAAAQPVIDRAVERADQLPEAERTAELEERIERAIHGRQVLLPLLSARAALLIAATTADERSRTVLARAAGDVARRVADVSAWAESERRLLSALSLALEGKGAEAQAELDAAEKSVSAKDAEAGLRQRVLAEAVFIRGLALLGSRGPMTAREWLEQAWERPPLLEGGRRDTALGLIAAEMMVRVAREESARLPTTADRDGPVMKALARYTELLVGLGAGERGAVYWALSRHVPTMMESERLPAVARVARAQARLAAGSGVEAAADLKVLVERGGSGALDADALLLRARSLASAGERGEAVAAATMFGEKFADDPRAGEALAEAAGFARADLRGEADGERVAVFAAALARIDEAKGAVPDRDGWRLELARLVRLRPATAELIGHASRAEEALGRIVAGEKIPEAAQERLLMWRDVLARLRRAASVDAGLDGEVLAASARLRAAAGKPLAGWESSGFEVSSLGSWVRTASAEALLAEGDAEGALSLVEGLGADWADAAAVVLEAHLAIGNAGAGPWLLGDLRRLADEASVRGVLEPLGARAWRDAEARVRGFIAGGPAGAGLDPLVFELIGSIAPDEAVWRERRAWASLLSGRSEEAAFLFEKELAARRRSDLLRGLGEARLAAGDPERAFAAFREIAEGLEAVQSYNDDYWHAWTRMLEILAARPDAKERGASIRREITRLRAMESAKQHGECVERIAQVESRLPAR